MAELTYHLRITHDPLGATEVECGVGFNGKTEQGSRTYDDPVVALEFATHLLQAWSDNLCGYVYDDTPGDLASRRKVK